MNEIQKFLDCLKKNELDKAKSSLSDILYAKANDRLEKLSKEIQK